MAVLGHSQLQTPPYSRRIRLTVYFTHRANPLRGVVMTFRRIMTVTIEGVLMLTLFPQNRLGEATVRSLVPTAKMLPLPQHQAAAFKQSLQENQKRLRQYEWIETTTVRVNGEAKGQRQSHCYYGTDGKVRRVPLSGSRRHRQATSLNMRSWSCPNTWTRRRRYSMNTVLPDRS